MAQAVYNESIAHQIEQQGGVEAYLLAQQQRIIAFFNLWNVDDGKSTLIGRLLHDTRQIYQDQLSTLQSDSKRIGTQGKSLTLLCWWMALLLNVSRGSQSMWLIVIFQQKNANLLLRTPRSRTIYAIWRQDRSLSILLIDARGTGANTST